MTNPFQTHGATSWIELHTDNVEAARDFYREVLDWELQAIEMPGGAYEMIKLGEASIGGLAAADGRPTRWLPYITVDDVDARVKRAETIGAKMIGAPQNVPGVGRMATIEDPTGGVICLMTYGAG